MVYPMIPVSGRRARAQSASGRRLMISINSSWNFVNFRSGLVQAFVAQGYEVIAVAPRDEYSSRLSELGCQFVPLDMDARGTSPVADGKLFVNYLRIMRRERPSAFLGFTPKPNIYGSLAARILGIPIINNIAGLGIAFSRRGWLQAVVQRLYRSALKRSAVVFFQNAEDSSLFRAGGLASPEQIHILPGSGVDLDRFAPIPKPEGTPFTFLLVARLLRTKGLLEYVEAARLLREEKPAARFLVAGIFDEAHRDGISRPAMDEWEREGAIEFLGSLDDVRPAIAQSDCLVLPTYYPEGTPRSILEAAAMARPIITTDVPGCREIVQDGVNGIICAPKDVSALAGAMRKLRDMAPSDREKMGRDARRRVAEHYDENIVIRAYLDAIDQALGAASPVQP